MLRQVGAPLLHDVYYAPIPRNELGKVSATNCIISHIGAAIFSFIASSYIDYCNETGNTRQMFIVIAFVVAVLSVIELVSHATAKEKPSTRSIDDKPTIKSDLAALFAYKPYLKLLIFYVIFHSSLSFLTPFIGTYQINELGFSMTRIYVLSLVQSGVSIMFLAVYSRYSATHSAATSLKIGLPLRTLALLLFLFIHPTGELGFIVMLIYVIVIAIASSFTDISISNIIYEVIPPHLRVAANAGLAIIGGIAAFLTTVAISPLFDYIQMAEISVRGIRIYAQQILGLIAATAMTLTFLFYLRYIENLKAPDITENTSPEDKY
jgi:MFS family permease